MLLIIWAFFTANLSKRVEIFPGALQGEKESLRELKVSLSKDSTSFDDRNSKTKKTARFSAMAPAKLLVRTVYQSSIK